MCDKRWKQTKNNLIQINIYYEIKFFLKKLKPNTQNKNALKSKCD